MIRKIALLLLPTLFFAACSQTTFVAADGTTKVGKVYRLPAGNSDKVQLRMLDSVNALRQAAGVSPVVLNAQLNAAAATHSRDMSVQNRPWHFGSDGSSPLERAARVGYTGTLKGEAISETFETEVETLAAWMEEEGTREVILDPAARDMGFAYYQETNGKIWWTLVLGDPGTPPARITASPSATAAF
ncbi:hypothetical protein BV394_09075 [Brevirhabdus pacifica]|uniref:Uncharacterized protein n=1 Tax=Brevirhabdus pacifica TaxID=1267768 RepID=A0A1U7DIW8_9RHOB|nr:CAP domain-containing protein [Brevirhabdus pacifica]APX89849.1 hypothetical protein BV394_09075 [Brevirhabdus pacifica]PJJ82937.1 Cysteine-rich secretory protein family protein [Brevirhabdus pacifica]